MMILLSILKVSIFVAVSLFGVRGLEVRILDDSFQVMMYRV